MTKKLCIFASGTGSNAKKIIDHFKNSSIAEVSLIISDKSNVGVLSIAQQENISWKVLKKGELLTESFVNTLRDQNISLIILAGFLKLIPLSLIRAFPDRIINIHPALLPKYGGKGMYGMNVHQAVKDNHETTSGITIHYVNEHFDDGLHIFQASCQVDAEDTPQIIARKVQALEHGYFAMVIEQVLHQKQLS